MVAVLVDNPILSFSHVSPLALHQTIPCQEEVSRLEEESLLTIHSQGNIRFSLLHRNFFY